MSESIGEQLRQARLGRELTLEQVSKATHIRTHYLEALENGDFRRIPSRVQARGFLRTYASYLSLQPQSLLALLEEGEKQPPLQEALQGQPVEAPASERREPAYEHEGGFYAEIGRMLVERRELLGFSLEDAERHTQIRCHHLEAMESGNFNKLPSPVHARGMLKNYAQFLGLDPEPVLLYYADALQARQAARQAALPKTKPRRRRPLFRFRLLSFISLDFLIGAALTAALAGFVIWGVIQINSSQAQTAPEPTLPSIVDALLQPPEEGDSPVEDATFTPDVDLNNEAPVPPEGEILEEVNEVEGEADEEVALPTVVEGAVQVHIVVRQRAWLRVIVDGEVVLEGRVLPGSAYTFTGQQLVRLLTGNGAALEVFFNQVSLGPLGIYGEVVDRSFTAEGPWTPTPMPTPVVTETPTPSPPVEVIETPGPTPAP